MRAKFGQPAEWAKFREPAILFGLTALLGTPFPFPFPVVVIGSMIWAVRHALLLNVRRLLIEMHTMPGRAISPVDAFLVEYCAPCGI